MSDVMHFSALHEPWRLRAAQISKLFAAVPVGPGATVLSMLDVQAAQTAVVWACEHCEATTMVMPADAMPEAVERVIAQTKPCVVVCSPAVFGWVSKLAFLGGSSAIYTCGKDGEGTLLDRAAHFVRGACDIFEPKKPQVCIYDAQGHRL